MTDDIVIIERFINSSHEHRVAFEALNREWLEKYFRVEPLDEKAFASPERIIMGGGVILFARAQGKIAGTASLLKHTDGSYELAKMAVTAVFQRRGIGRMLCEALLDIVRQKPVDKLYIITNDTLDDALRLYRKLGFVQSAENRHDCYERGNLTLEKPLARAETAA